MCRLFAGVSAGGVSLVPDCVPDSPTSRLRVPARVVLLAIDGSLEGKTYSGSVHGRPTITLDVPG